MVTSVFEPISVLLAYNHLNKKVLPKQIFWRGRVYSVNKLGLHHFFWQGRTLKHIFTVISGETCFKLCLDTETLHWVLEEVSTE